MIELGGGTFQADVDYLDRPEHIAAAVLECGDGLLIVDPGPTTGLRGLSGRLAAIGASIEDISRLLITHIHLDHSGGAGVLVRQNPRIGVHVHERGARHLLDPGRLLDSATRLYGDEMERLWGEVAPVPPENVHVLQGGETLRPGGRSLRVEYTPGHAWHHVSYLDENTGIAFVGDTCGERFRGAPYVLPVTPPPDIDLEAWAGSFARIRAWGPETLFVTHFGACSEPGTHIDMLAAEMADWAERVRVSLDRGGTDEERAARFAEEVWDRVESRVDVDTVPLYRDGAPDASWLGLARYWRKQAETS